MRRAAKVDLNQSEIVTALRRVGASVQPLHAVGAGCPDLLVGFRRACFTLEIKQPKSRERRTPEQIEWHAAWRGHVAVVTNIAEALAAIGVEISAS